MFHFVSILIERFFNSLKTVVEWEAQKAIYTKHVQKIKLGHDKMLELVSELLEVPCTKKKECSRDKIKLTERYVKFLDVESSLESLIAGSLTKGDQLVSNLPSVLAKKSKCDIPKLEVQITYLKSSLSNFPN